MHSFWYRANAVLTFGVTMLAVMCTFASLSDNFNLPSPSAQVKILNINWFQKQANGNDEVSMTLNVSSDLSSLFTWNTKQVFVFVAAEYETPQNALNQVSLWDGIIPSREHSKFWIHTTNKYRFVDQDVANTNYYWYVPVPPIQTKYFGQGLVWSVSGQSRICHCLYEGSNLKGKAFNLTLHWHIMPKTGKMFADKIVMTGYRLPEEYR